MSKSGRQYADEVRALREAGLDFPASEGYRLNDAANWSPGLKSAVTRAVNELDLELFDDELGFTEEEGLAFFEDAAGDLDEQWDDIDYLDFDEAEEFEDEEGDTYEETT